MHLVKSWLKIQNIVFVYLAVKICWRVQLSYLRRDWPLDAPLLLRWRWRWCKWLSLARLPQAPGLPFRFLTTSLRTTTCSIVVRQSGVTGDRCFPWRCDTEKLAAVGLRFFHLSEAFLTNIAMETLSGGHKHADAGTDVMGAEQEFP